MGYICYDIDLAGTLVTGAFQHPETAELFGRYCLGVSEKNSGIRIPEHELKTWLSFGNEPGAQFEYSCFTAAASDAISESGRFIMHAVAFRWRDRAYLISAPSGGGKSTLIRTLQEQHPGDFSVICGDRPIIRKMDDGSLLVCPSPWNGKENWSGADAAPLAATILLKRTGQNWLEYLPHRDAVVPVYLSLIQTRETEELIQRFAGFAGDLIKAAPVLLLESAEAADSVPLLYDALFAPEVT